MTSPALFRPKSVGASLIVNSLTKYIGGHGNVLGGALTATGLYDWADYPHIQAPYKKGASTTWGPTQIREEGIARRGRDVVGGGGAFDRGWRRNTGVADRAHVLECDGGGEVSGSASKVAKVHYPGLPSHAQHERAADCSAVSAVCLRSS
jgi:O-acetylhomoserine (thiol)-lyase